MHITTPCASPCQLSDYIVTNGKKEKKDVQTYADNRPSANPVDKGFEDDERPTAEHRANRNHHTAETHHLVLSWTKMILHHVHHLPTTCYYLLLLLLPTTHHLPVRQLYGEADTGGKGSSPEGCFEA